MLQSHRLAPGRPVQHAAPISLLCSSTRPRMLHPHTLQGSKRADFPMLRGKPHRGEASQRMPSCTYSFFICTNRCLLRGGSTVADVQNGSRFPLSLGRPSRPVTCPLTLLNLLRIPGPGAAPRKRIRPPRSFERRRPSPSRAPVLHPDPPSDPVFVLGSATSLRERGSSPGPARATGEKPFTPRSASRAARSPSGRSLVPQDPFRCSPGHRATPGRGGLRP